MADSTSTSSKTKKTEEVNPLDILRENAGVMIAVLVVLLAFAALIVWQSGQSQAANDEAWWALAEKTGVGETGVEGFDELLKKHGDGPAGVQIRITYASRLYETGVRADVEKAKTLYEEAAKACKGDSVMHEALTKQVESIKKELEADPSALLEEAPPPAPEEPAAPNFPAGGGMFPPVESGQ